MSKRRCAILISGRGSNMESLIEAARDSGHELAIALGERLEQLAPDAERADGLEYENARLEEEATSHYGEYTAISDALDAANKEIKELQALLADLTGCAK